MEPEQKRKVKTKIAYWYCENIRNPLKNTRENQRIRIKKIRENQQAWHCRRQKNHGERERNISTWRTVAVSAAVDRRRRRRGESTDRHAASLNSNYAHLSLSTLNLQEHLQRKSTENIISGFKASVWVWETVVVRVGWARVSYLLIHVGIANDNIAPSLPRFSNTHKRK